MTDTSQGWKDGCWTVHGRGAGCSGSFSQSEGVVAWAWEAEHRELYTVTECQFPKGQCLGIGCLQSDNGGEVGPCHYIMFYAML